MKAWSGKMAVAFTCIGCLLLGGVSAISLKAQPDRAKLSRRAAILKGIIEQFRVESRFPGAVAGAWFADSSSVAVSVGLADRKIAAPMTDRAVLHAGSIGKTFFAAWALQLVGEKRIALDDRVEKYLGSQPWYAATPNAKTITIRMLLNHTSGIPEYGSDFMGSLIKEPGRVRSPLDAVKSVAGANARSAPGASFTYSDVNYQLLQLVLERVTGKRAYDEIQRRLLKPYALLSIAPANRKAIPALVQGYAGDRNFLGFDAVMVNGELILDPSFEGGGGGFVSNARDLARWVPLFVEGKVFPRSLLPDLRRGVPAGQLDVGKDARSGLGIEIVQTPLGVAYGHGGFFPGYLSLVLWYPDVGISLAIQVNSSAEGALARPLRDVLLAAAQALTDPKVATNRLQESPTITVKNRNPGKMWHVSLKEEFCAGSNCRPQRSFSRITTINAICRRSVPWGGRRDLSPAEPFATLGRANLRLRVALLAAKNVSAQRHSGATLRDEDTITLMEVFGHLGR
jgi:D-alanyl-D-alanine carboxypeptidase